MMSSFALTVLQSCQMPQAESVSAMLNPIKTQRASRFTLRERCRKKAPYVGLDTTIQHNVKCVVRNFFKFWNAVERS